MTPLTETMADHRSFPAKHLLGRLWAASGNSPAWPLLILLCIFFSLQTPLFLTPININIILGQTVLVGILAVGLTPLAISGNIDLSVGAVAAISSCVCVVVQSQLGFVPSIVATLGVATLLGLANGLIVEKLGLNSIIVTLAMGTALDGAAFMIFGSQTILAVGAEYLNLGSLKLFGVNFTVILFLLLALLLAAVLRYTVHGVNTFAIGGSRHAAVGAGVNVQGHVLANFALSGAMAGVCGLVLVTGMGAGSATFANGYELWAIIAVVLGGTRLAGGAGTIAGTIAAALSLTVLRNGMNLMKIDARWFLIALGTSLIVALVLDRLKSGEPDVAE